MLGSCRLAAHLRPGDWVPLRERLCPSAAWAEVRWVARAPGGLVVVGLRHWGGRLLRVYPLWRWVETAAEEVD